MALSVGTNWITKAEDGAADVLSSMAEFQTFARAANSTEARARIRLESVPRPNKEGEIITPEEWQALRPLCVLEIINPFLRTEATGGVFTASGGECVAFFMGNVEHLPNSPSTREEKLREVKNMVGNVWQAFMRQTQWIGHASLETNWGLFDEQTTGATGEGYKAFIHFMWGDRS